MRPCFSQAINTDSKYYILVSTTNNQTISSQLTTKAPKNSAVVQAAMHIAPDKDWRQLGIYPPLFDLIGYFKF